MIRSVALTAFTRIALTAFGLGTSIITARHLGQAGRGDYFFMVTLSGTMVQLANLGLPSSNTYLVARRGQRLGALLGNSVWVSFGVAGGIGAAVALVAHSTGMLEDTPVSYLWLAAALAPPSLLYLLASNLLVGVERISAYNGVEVGSRVLVIVGMLVAVMLGSGPRGFIGAAVVSWLAAAVATVGLVSSRRTNAMRFDTAVFREGFRYATKAYATTLLGFLVLRANVFLLRREHGPAELGLYSIAVQIADVLAVLPQAVALVLFPQLVRQAASRWETTVRAATILAVVMILACGVTALVAKPAIKLLFGDAFEPSARVLYWSLPGVVFWGVAAVFSQYLGAVGIPRPLVAVWAGAVILVVALSFALVPGRGSAGAAVALSATSGALLVAVVLLSLRHHRRDRRRPPTTPAPPPSSDDPRAEGG